MFLAVFMAFVLLAVGFALGEIFLGGGLGFFGMAAAFVFWIMLTLVSYYSGDKILLGVSGARKITHDDMPELFNVVEEMKIASGFTRVPDIYIIDDPSPNAFATGRSPKTASVAVTSGLLSRLNRDELQGVIAHEMSHIVNRDVLFMMMLGIMLGAVVMMADMFFRVSFHTGVGRRTRSGGGQAQIVMLVISIAFLILAPFIAQIIYFAASRKREYLADACGAQLTRYPDGLANALQKIAGSTQAVKQANRVTAPMYIVNPFSGMKKAAASLMSTHPPIEDRIRILRKMGGNHSLEAYQNAWQAAVPAGMPRNLISAKDMKANAFVAAGAAAAVAQPTRRPAQATPVSQQQVSQQPAAQTSPAQQPVASRIALNDFFWKQDGYVFVDCDCGVRLKIPPQYNSKTVHCPKCRKKYQVPVM